jgi:hypothetical protein
MRDVIWCVMEFVSLVGSRSVGLGYLYMILFALFK